MNGSLRRFAGVAAGVAGAVAVAGLLMSWAVAGTPAAADPTPPTLESLEPPAPPPAPRPVQPPAPVGSSSNTGADDAAIRQVVAASTGAYNAEDWDGFMAQICSARAGNFNLDMIKNQRAERGPMQVTVTAVTVTGDSATATTVMTQRVTVTAPYHMVRENGWKIC
ncbi:hypothetical protein E2F47_20575 [Mycobacterium eburneum]|nr:hypothetical protein [Mycobacterium eburneum]TDH49480.1 hypothetical protein E2F47_20575 [Mycobacterium eburneum]